MKITKKEVFNLLKNWYKGQEWNVIYIWKKEDVWFVVIKYYIKDYSENKKLDFCRVFPSLRIENKLHITVEETIKISDL